MKYYNITHLFNLIINKIDNYFITIVAPKLSGNKYFLNKLATRFEGSPKTLVFVFDFSTLELNVLENLIIEKSLLEYDLTLNSSNSEIPFGEKLYHLIKQIDLRFVNNVIIMVNDTNLDNLNASYTLLSQLRNLREIINTNKFPINLKILYSGNWLPNELNKMCQRLIASSFPEELYFTETDCEEISNLLNQNNSNLDNHIVEYLYDITGGCFGYIDYIVNNIKGKINCENIRKKIEEICSSEVFYKFIGDSIRNLSDKALNIFNHLLDNKIYVCKRNIETEELLLSGLVRYEQLGNKNILKIRSWIHEKTIRDNESIYKLLKRSDKRLESSFVIPPTPSVNTLAYRVLLEIENLLRNIFIIQLAKNNCNSRNPYEIANSIGRINENWAKNTLVEELNYQRKKVLDKYYDVVEGYSSMNSFINIADLSELILNKMNSFFDDIITNNQSNKDMFEKLRIIRNQIAHNNIITEKAIDDLINIKMTILKYLSK